MSKKEIFNKEVNNKGKEKEEIEIVIIEHLKVLKECGIKDLVETYLSPLYIEAQKSNEFKQATKELLKNASKSKDNFSRILEEMLTKERGYITDTEKVLVDTCIAINFFIEDILKDWNINSKQEIHKYLENLKLRYYKLEIVTKCLEKYFVKVDKVEDYVELRNWLYRMITDIEETVKMYKKYILET